MKKLLSILTCIALSSPVFAADVMVTDDITADTTWTADNEYIFDKPIFVKNGAVLTIEPGTTIYGNRNIGNDTFGSLIITRGCKIMADGTPNNPIVFTALQEREGIDDGSGLRDLTLTDNMLWGGLIILGQAILNTPDNPIINPGAPVIGEFQIEGFPAGDNADITYGGDNDADDSGVLRFVSIRYGGFEFQVDEEINGLTLGAVGSGTTIEFVEVFNNSDDGVEMFGGTVNLKYMVMAFNEDESFDWDQGYRGKGQFWVAIQKNVGVGSNYGAEMDGGDSNPKTLMPFATPMVYNATYIGSGSGATNPQTNSTWRMKDNTGGGYYNSLFTDFSDYVIRIDDTDTEAMVDAGLLNSGGNVFGSYTDWDGTNASLTNNNSTQELAMLTGTGTNTNTILGDQLVINSVSRDTDGGLDPRVLDLTSPVYDTSNMVPLPEADPFYTEVDHKGAVGTFNWLKGWTALDQLGYLASSPDDLKLDSEFLNVSTRGYVAAEAEREMNIGFIIIGSEPQTVYLTGKGPSLPVGSPLDDPKITLVDQVTQAVIESNSSWIDSPNKGLIESTLIPPTNDLEAAIVVTLPPGAYVLLVETESGNPGIAIGEAFKFE